MPLELRGHAHTWMYVVLDNESSDSPIPPTHNRFCIHRIVCLCVAASVELLSALFAFIVFNFIHILLKCITLGFRVIN